MRFAALVTIMLVLAFVVACRPNPPTYAERLAQIQSDTKLTDAQAIEGYAALWFNSAETTSSEKQGRINADIRFHGYDESRVAKYDLKPPAGIGSFFEFVQITEILRNLDGFIPLAKERKLNELTITLQTPTFVGSDVGEWVDTYRVRMTAKQMDALLKTSKLDLEKRVKMAPQLWKIELNRFKEFTYEKVE